VHLGFICVQIAKVLLKDWCVLWFIWWV